MIDYRRLSFSDEAAIVMRASFNESITAWRGLVLTAVSMYTQSKHRLRAVLQPHFDGSLEDEDQTITQKSSREAVMDVVTGITDRLAWNKAQKVAHVNTFRALLAENPPSKIEATYDLSAGLQQLQGDILAPCTHLLQELKKVEPPSRWIDGQGGSNEGTPWPEEAERHLYWVGQVASRVANTILRTYTNSEPTVGPVSEAAVSAVTVSIHPSTQRGTEVRDKVQVSRAPSRARRMGSLRTRPASNAARGPSRKPPENTHTAQGTAGHYSAEDDIASYLLRLTAYDSVCIAELNKRNALERIQPDIVSMKRRIRNSVTERAASA